MKKFIYILFTLLLLVSAYSLFLFGPSWYLSYQLQKEGFSEVSWTTSWRFSGFVLENIYLKKRDQGDLFVVKGDKLKLSYDFSNLSIAIKGSGFDIAKSRESSENMEYDVGFLQTLPDYLSIAQRISSISLNDVKLNLISKEKTKKFTGNIHISKEDDGYLLKLDGIKGMKKPFNLKTFLKINQVANGYNLNMLRTILSYNSLKATLNNIILEFRRDQDKKDTIHLIFDGLNAEKDAKDNIMINHLIGSYELSKNNFSFTVDELQHREKTFKDIDVKGFWQKEVDDFNYDINFAIKTIPYYDLTPVKGHLTGINNTIKLIAKNDQFNVLGEGAASKNKIDFNVDVDLKKDFHISKQNKSIVKKGSINVKGEILNYKKVDVSVKGKEVFAVINDVEFDKVSFNSEIKGEHPKLHLTFESDVAKLNDEFHLTEISIKGEVVDLYNASVVKINKLAGNFGGGVFKLKSFFLDFIKPVILSINFDNVDVNKISGNLKDSKLKMTGVFDGDIDLEYYQGNVSIKDGAFMADPPGGYMNYTLLDDSVIAQKIKEATTLPSDTWKDFKYTKFDVKLEKEGSNLIIKSYIYGMNKNVQKGIPVELNLNISIPLDSILKSWKLSADFGKGILPLKKQKE